MRLGSRQSNLGSRTSVLGSIIRDAIGGPIRGITNTLAAIRGTKDTI